MLRKSSNQSESCVKVAFGEHAQLLRPGGRSKFSIGSWDSPARTGSVASSHSDLQKADPSRAAAGFGVLRASIPGQR